MQRHDAHTPSADRVGGPPYRLLRCSHIFSSAVREILESRYLAEVSARSLSIPQFHLLKLIGLNGHHQVGEVAGFLGVSAPAASKNIDRLCRLGLVERGSCDEDRRATLLSASAKGRDLIRRYEQLKKQRLALVLAKFEAAEIDRFSDLLERFSVLLFEQEKGEGGFCLRCAAYCEVGCPIGDVFGHCPYDTIRSKRRGRKPVVKEEVS